MNTLNKVLKETINDILLEVTELVSAHLANSNMSDDQLSTALDLWYSKLSATAQILPGLNINGRSEDLIIDEDRVAIFPKGYFSEYFFGVYQMCKTKQPHWF